MLLSTPKLTGRQIVDEKPKLPIDLLAVIETPDNDFIPSYEP